MDAVKLGESQRKHPPAPKRHRSEHQDQDEQQTPKQHRTASFDSAKFEEYYPMVKECGLKLREVPIQHRSYALCLAAMKQNPAALEHAPKEYILGALRADGARMQLLPESCLDEEICVTAVQDNWTLLGDIPEGHRTKSVCLAAVRESGLALEDVPMQLRTEELCAAAFQQTPMALKDIPSELVTDAMRLTAVKDRGVALEHIPEDRRTEAICLAAVNASRYALQHVPERHRSKCLAAHLLQW
jgi:hypothetical protein